MYAKRVVFKKESRKLFFSRILNGKSLRKFCRTNELIYSTFKGYRQGHSTLPLDVFDRLVEINNINLDNITYEIIPATWWQSAAGKKGIRKLFQKYDERTLTAWRSKGGQNSPISNIKEINSPLCINENVAELLGAYLGDGTLTNYFIRISGDKRFDFPYFKYLVDLTKEVFDLEPTIRVEKHRNQLYLEIRSKAVCDYFKNVLGLKTGDKIRNKSTIPENVMKKKPLFFACLRGLVDTDGSVSKDGGILSIRFAAHNAALLNQLKESPFLSGIFTIKSSSKETGTRSFGKIIKYFSLAGSSNLRHVVRYREYLKGNLLGKEEILSYYPNYKNIVLPFKG